MDGKPNRERGDPEPLECGQTLNLRREMPGGPRAHLDIGWEVCGYTYKQSGKWLGYLLRNVQGRTTSASKFEAIDRVEG